MRGSKVALVAVIVVVIVGMGALDKILATAQDEEVQRLAQRSYMDGLSGLRAGKVDAAVESFRKAHALERSNSEYALELASALISDHKLDEAKRLLDEVLERSPNDGRANLLTARLMIQRGNAGEAESYYHRAIYGVWGTDGAAQSVAARMELIDYLAGKAGHEGLLAELIALPEEAVKTAGQEEHLAELFLEAGAAGRARDEFRAVIKREPKNARAYAGLGEAELQMGEYGKARDAFSAATMRAPEDAGIKQKLDLTNTLAVLDPTVRRLTSMEKYRRSLELLGMAQMSLEECVGDRTEEQPLLAEMREVLTDKTRGEVANETAEGVLSLAERAWQERVKICGPGMGQAEEPLRLIVERLGR